MKKTYVLISLIILAIVGAGYYVYSKNNDTATAPVNEAAPSINTTDTTAEQVDGESSVATKPGRYLDYSETVLASISGIKLLFFYAPWCPQCRELEQSIKTSILTNDTTIFKVDYDSNQELRQKYGVTIQTTVVKVDASGNKIASYVAYEAPVFASVKAALLQ